MAADPASLKERISDDLKAAMRAQDKRRVGVLRLINAAIKQREVDDRVVLDDPAILGILDKMVKQRRDSLTQYLAGNRQDLADQEQYEIDLIQGFLPKALTAVEIDDLITSAIQETGASSPKDMGKVMGVLRSQVQGRADVAAVSAQVKTRLAAL